MQRNIRKTVEYVSALLMISVIIFTGSVSAQKNSQTESLTDKEKLRQLNDFIKKSFSETYKSQGISKIINLEAKTKTSSSLQYEGQFINFNGCNISFFSRWKRESPKYDSFEKVFISLKNIDLENTYLTNDSYFPDKKDVITIHFRTKGNKIRSQGQFLSTVSGPSDRYLPQDKLMSQYFVTLKTTVKIEEIRTALRNAVEICQKD